MGALEIIFGIGLAIGPHIGYVVQYVEIVKRNSLQGYAPVVSLILLTSNTLRILYYIGHRYLVALLVQSALGVVVHGVVLWTVLELHRQLILRGTVEYSFETEASVDYGITTPTVDGPGAEGGASRIGYNSAKRNHGPKEADDRAPTPNTAVLAPARAGMDTYGSRHEGQEQVEPAGDDAPASRPGFLQRAAHKLLSALFFVEDGIEEKLMGHTPIQFIYHYVILATITTVLSLAYYATVRYFWSSAAELIGYASLGIEALMVVPQILCNARRHSTKGLSILLVLTWVGGDVAKVIYYIFAGQALAFVVCGCFQIFLDVIVVAQLVYYRILHRQRDDTEGEENVVSVQVESTNNGYYQ